ncbi:MAG: hypothetical protein C4526_08570 [Nitrospiraceae bacterium]|nr:MAG: hypothetical protein C4526_08570 [Nitrospiraceae bacterium]
MEDSVKSNHTTGGYIDAWCTKCELELGHTIIAMVNNLPKRVKCNTCNGEHNFRKKLSEKVRTGIKTPARKTRSLEATYTEQLSRLTGGDLSIATKYSLNGNFRKDEVIDHPRFGIGIVLSVIQTNKMEILFKDGARMLVQNQ